MPLNYKEQTHLKDRAWKELDLKNLAHNVGELNAIMPEGCSLMAILKANAYGHGAYEISKELMKLGIDAYAVATLDEGIELRTFGVKGIILVLGYTDPFRASDLNKHRITQCVFDTEYAEKLNSVGYKLSVHIAIDSGMHRLGIDSNDTNAVKSIYNMNNLSVDGIFTHLCSCDSLKDEEVAYTNKQINAFMSVIDHLKASGYDVKSKHIQSSYGLINYPDIKCDYARIGISLYGVDSSVVSDKLRKINVRPVMSLKSRIIQVRSLNADEYVGYSRTFKTERESRIAVVPVGYADGLPRCLSGGKAEVLVCGKRAPIIGRICMDQFIIDITDIPGACFNSVVTVIGNDGEESISAEELASKADTITNDLLSGLGQRFSVHTI